MSTRHQARAKRMNCMEFQERVCNDSKIHGCSYIVRKDLHWVERVFWLLIVIVATYYSVKVCLDQWQRYQDNPIVYQYELTDHRSEYPKIGMTLCLNYTDVKDTQRIIYEIWNVTLSNTKYLSYLQFLHYLNTMTMDNLGLLKPFANDSSFEQIDFVTILLRLRRKLKNELDGYVESLSEMGLCRTNSQLAKYTNPTDEQALLELGNISTCAAVDDCHTRVTPKLGSKHKMRVYFHDISDIASFIKPDTIMIEVPAERKLESELLVDLTTSDSEVRRLPLRGRKCRFMDENNLKYFQTYLPSLCQMECRIDAAMRLCNCKPYFYAVAKHLPVCSISGLVCLNHQNWHKINCTCLQLCEQRRYTIVRKSTASEVSISTERNVLVKQSLVKYSIKRRVVFSDDQLFMSFGGAIGIMLGASLYSFYNIFLVIVEYGYRNCVSVCTQKRGKVRHASDTHNVEIQ